jgi:hypothetical protein
MFVKNAASAQGLRFMQVMKLVFPTKGVAALVTIGMIDLISTAVLHKQGLITEMNPLMRVFIERNEWLFAFVKGMTIGAAWTALVWYAQQNKQFVARAAAWGAAAYLVLWGSWFFAGSVG